MAATSAEARAQIVALVRDFVRREVEPVAVTGPGDILDSGSRNHKDTLNNIASMMSYPGAGSGDWIRGWQSAQVGHTSQRVSFPGHTIPLRSVLPVPSFSPKRGTASGTPKNGCTSIAGCRCESHRQPRYTQG